MPPELADFVAQELPTNPAIGIPIALLGAVLISFGTQLQHAGVSAVDQATEESAKKGLSVRQLLALLARPTWVVGTLVLGLAILVQLTSLVFAPLTVVQPLGALALVVTAIMNARISHIKLDGASIRAIGLCVVGVAIFVTVAAFNTQSNPITDLQLRVILILLASVLVIFTVLFLILRKRDKMNAIFYIIAAGVLFGFVATLAKTVIDVIKTLNVTDIQPGDVSGLTIVCVIGIGVAALVGSYFVQTAYSNGPPDLVVAGLTVVDPLVAVLIGIIVLGEAAEAPPWAFVAFIVAGGIAVLGVFQLAKHHPQAQH